MTAADYAKGDWTGRTWSCTAITAAGQPCKNKATRGDHCGIHAAAGWRISDGRTYPVTITGPGEPGTSDLLQH